MTGIRDLARVPNGEQLDGAVSIERLYETEAPRLLRYFRGKTDRHAAPDLVQEAFARLAAIGRFADLANPAAYLQRIARNILADRAHSHIRDTLHVELTEWDAAAAPEQEQALHVEDLLRTFEEAISALPERTRTIFLLQRADGLTYRQISARLGVSLWAVEHHMKRALAHLDRALSE